MIKRVEEVCQQYKTPYALYPMTFSEMAKKELSFWGGSFDVAIALGVCMYINDEELTKVFQYLPNLLSDSCTLYFAEPVGLDRRLSLVNFPSAELKTEYNAIYRTVEEYLAMYQPLLDAGFSIVEHAYKPQFGESYSDTGRWYSILKR